METTIDSKFTENTEAIISQFGFKDLKSFIKNQALLMLMAKIDKFEAENKQYEAKYQVSFHDFKKQMEDMRGMEDIVKEEDYLDWRFAVEARDRLNKQKLELENA
ncbi:MAG: hypothetical protein LC660_07540 [Desulfobacteraceae bacterium]|jgi:hypothetical protein|nr:hypothetical protein [Desulfobacteraceae bacterium]